MSRLKKISANVIGENRGLFVLMIFNLLINITLFICFFVCMDFNSSNAKIGYGDIGGYRSGSWLNIIAFPISSLLFGVIHNILAVRIYRRSGASVSKIFVVTTILLSFFTFTILLKLIGEK